MQQLLTAIIQEFLLRTQHYPSLCFSSAGSRQPRGKIILVEVIPALILPSLIALLFLQELPNIAGRPEHVDAFHELLRWTSCLNTSHEAIYPNL